MGSPRMRECPDLSNEGDLPTDFLSLVEFPRLHLKNDVNKHLGNTNDIQMLYKRPPTNLSSE